MTFVWKRPRFLTLLFSAGAALLFVPLFIFRRMGPLDFWWGLSFNVLVLSGLGFLTDRSFRQDMLSGATIKLPAQICLGVISAGVLYLVFLGGGAALSAFFPAAQNGIDSVYGFKAGASTARVVALLALAIGPGEEFFWRGFLQRRMQRQWGGLKGWLTATALYTAVHLGSGNLMLVLAAGVCGLFWGFLFFRFRSLLLNAVSHTLWDLAVFILWPVL